MSIEIYADFMYVCTSYVSLYKYMVHASQTAA